MDKNILDKFQGLNGNIYFMGIIDILQKYNARKKFETAFKSISADVHEISCVDPQAYGRRFLSFMTKVIVTTPGAHPFLHSQSLTTSSTRM